MGDRHGNWRGYALVLLALAQATPALADGSDEKAATAQLDALLKCKKSGTGCVASPSWVRDQLTKCFTGKSSDAAKASECVQPQLEPIAGKIAAAWSECTKRVPTANRGDCIKKFDGAGSQNDEARVVTCFHQSLKPPNPAAAEACEAFNDLFRGLNAYMGVCKDLGGSCKMPAMAVKAQDYDPSAPSTLPKATGTSSAPPAVASPGAAAPVEGAKGSSGGKPAVLFGPACAGGGNAYSCFSPGGNELVDAYGVSAQCMNNYVCNLAWAVHNFFPSFSDLSSTRALLDESLKRVEERYRRLRAEMLKRLMIQVGAISAAESQSCGPALDGLATEWKGKLARCQAIDPAAVLADGMTSAAARARNDAICKANGGGDATAKKKYADGLKSDARALLLEKCAMRYLRSYPQEGTSDSYDDRVRKMKDADERFYSGDCKPVAGDAIERAKRNSLWTLQFPLPYPEHDKDVKKDLVASGEAHLACVESSVSPRLLGLDDEDLDKVSKGTLGSPLYAKSEAYKNLTSVFDRACAFGDPRGDAARLVGDDGAFSLDQLEDLLGGSVADKPPLSAGDRKIRDELAACVRKSRSTSSLERTMTGLEQSCAAFTAVSAIPAVALGPEALAPVALINLGCAVPPGVNAAINADKKHQLTSYRRAMGNQIDCDDAARLMKAESELGEKIGDGLLQAALSAGLSAFEIAGLIRGARSAAAAEAAIKERLRLMEGTGKTLGEAFPALKNLPAGRMSRLLDEIEAQRPLRSQFGEGAVGDKAYKDAASAFEKRVSDAVGDVSKSGAKSAEDIAGALEKKLAPESRSVAVSDAQRASARDSLKSRLEKELGEAKAKARFPCLYK
ncbi:MAG: hypothetical protein HY075_08770 [Deltaproteobacteria bacterium]|nr:hypothetical protein [Deltaproteobacteria bacterium]